MEDEKGGRKGNDEHKVVVDGQEQRAKSAGDPARGVMNVM